jgi:hypothetical protein
MESIMPTIITFVRGDRIFNQIATRGARDAKKQLTAMGVIWPHGHAKQGNYRDANGRDWIVKLTSAPMTKANVVAPDFLNQSE